MYRNHVHRRGRVVRLSGHKTPRPDGANPLLQAAYVRHRILFTSVTDNTPTHTHTHIHTHAHTHTLASPPHKAAGRAVHAACVETDTLMSATGIAPL